MYMPIFIYIHILICICTFIFIVYVYYRHRETERGETDRTSEVMNRALAAFIIGPGAVCCGFQVTWRSEQLRVVFSSCLNTKLSS